MSASSQLAHLGKAKHNSESQHTPSRVCFMWTTLVRSDERLRQTMSPPKASLLRPCFRMRWTMRIDPEARTVVASAERSPSLFCQRSLASLAFLRPLVDCTSYTPDDIGRTIGVP